MLEIGILDIIYPPSCGICGKLGSFLCKKCKINLEKQLISETIDFSSDNEKYFDKYTYLYKYDGIIRKLILQYKFKDKSYLYKMFLENIKNNEKMYLFLKKYDIIMPVPISNKRMKERGYNQSSLLAKEMAKLLGIEYKENCLIKMKDIVPQSRLKKEDRQLNVQDVYGIKNIKYTENKKVLLVDDIFTTGSTVNECSKTLKRSGAVEIGVFTIAKD